MAEWQLVGMHARTKALLFRGLFVLWGVMLLAFSFGTMWQRARLDFDGTIEHRDQKRDWSGPHRYYTVYIIRPATGGNSFQYVATEHHEVQGGQKSNASSTPWR